MRWYDFGFEFKINFHLINLFDVLQQPVQDGISVNFILIGSFDCELIETDYLRDWQVLNVLCICLGKSINLPTIKSYRYRLLCNNKNVQKPIQMASTVC